MSLGVDAEIRPSGSHFPLLVPQLGEVADTKNKKKTNLPAFGIVL